MNAAATWMTVLASNKGYAYDAKEDLKNKKKDF